MTPRCSRRPTLVFCSARRRTFRENTRSSKQLKPTRTCASLSRRPSKRTLILCLRFAAGQITQRPRRILLLVKHGINFIDDRRGHVELVRQLPRGARGRITFGHVDHARENVGHLLAATESLAKAAV